MEWCVSNETLWVLQLDLEDDQPDEGVDPTLIPKVRILRADKNTKVTNAAFRRYKPRRATRWSKLANINDFVTGSDSSAPILFYVTAHNIRRRLCNPNTTSHLRREIGVLTSGRAVIRTDSEDRKVGAFNLPKTQTVNSEQAVIWLRHQISEFRTQRANLRNVCFILHRYIPARSAAWSYYALGKSIVEIDCLWGLPDGLQFLPHDSFEIDVQRYEILSERTRFKPRFLQEQQDGSWIYVTVKRSLGRHRSLSEEALMEIAERTRDIANRIQSDAQIMWFCDIPRELGLGTHLPWYRARDSVDRTPVRPPPLQIEEVSGPNDLDNLSNVSSGQRILQITPDANLIRDEEFLNKIVVLAKKKKFPIQLAGSPLGHAYYKFRQAGLLVYSADPASHFRVRGRKIFHKIVRDQIPDNIASRGERVIRARLAPSDAVRGLVSKLLEEALELVHARNSDEITEELADLHEVLRGIAKEAAVEWDYVVAEAERKRKERGGFEGGTVLLETSLPQRTKPSSDNEEECGVTLEEIGHAIIEDNTASIPFSRLVARAGPPTLEIPLGDDMLKITIRLESGAIVLTLERDETSEVTSAQFEFDLP